MGDFAILLRAGFDRWSAAKLQLSTALGGVLGACFAICAQSPKETGKTKVFGERPDLHSFPASSWSQIQFALFLQGKPLLGFFHLPLGDSCTSPW